jgi:hypothetical protein
MRLSVASSAAAEKLVNERSTPGITSEVTLNSKWSVARRDFTPVEPGASTGRARKSGPYRLSASVSRRDLEGEVRRCPDWNKLTGVAVFLGVAAGNLPTSTERRCRCSPNHRSRVDRRELTLDITEY